MQSTCIPAIAFPFLNSQTWLTFAAMIQFQPDDTICALSTPPGTGALAIIRISGNEALTIFSKIFSKDLTNSEGYTIHFGKILRNNEIIDEVLASVFRAPRSFTGEESIEISCHGSPYIQSQILQLLIKNGCRMAQPGEFSMRAFANGKVDLSQAEAIADLIASSTSASHKLAMNQMRGGFSKKIKELREKLINFASLIELELDFSEEDVEFANREELTELVTGIDVIVKNLIESFATGNAIKNGVPVAILGAPNMGKSTLLNALLEDERAIVSEIAGTTRDTIEDEMVIDGVRFRFTDTAGIRETTDEIETIGISRAFEKAGKSAVVIYLFDAAESSQEQVSKELHTLQSKVGDAVSIILIGNKIDKLSSNGSPSTPPHKIEDALYISAKAGTGLDELKSRLLEITKSTSAEGNDIVVSNLRHLEALSKAHEALESVLSGIDSGITGDFLAMDIRRGLFHLGEITGEITTEDLLGNIFSKFCIGK